MNKIIGSFSTRVTLTDDEAKSICKLGQGAECCAYLGAGAGGFRCLKMEFPLNETINQRIKTGTMNAKGIGGWAGCAWEETDEHTGLQPTA